MGCRNAEDDGAAARSAWTAPGKTPSKASAGRRIHVINPRARLGSYILRILLWSDLRRADRTVCWGIDRSVITRTAPCHGSSAALIDAGSLTLKMVWGYTRTL